MVDKRYLEFVEDSTFQARTPSDDTQVEDSVRRMRELWRARDYDAILKAAKEAPEDPGICSYEAMALRAMGRTDESIIPILRGLRFENDPAARAKLYNQLAIRVFFISEDDQLAEEIAALAWRTSRDGRQRGWNPVLTQCEVKLLRARAGKADMASTLAAVGNLIEELLDCFPGYEADQEFINYIHREVNLQEYKESEHWKKLFGHTRPQ